MKKLWFILVALFTLLPLRAGAESFDMDEYLYGHVRDSYEWHITTVNGKPVSIYLPVVVISRAGTGLHCFSSRHVAEGESWEGFRIAGSDEKYSNKLVEELIRTCRPSTKLCIASDITCEDEYIHTRPVKEWAGKVPDLSKKPTIFLIYK